MSLLSEIDLSFNDIGNCFAVPFLSFPELKIIDLRNNRIEFIADTFKYNEKLEKLRLQNNPIQSMTCLEFDFLERSVSTDISWDDVQRFDMDNCWVLSQQCAFTKSIS